MAYSSRTTVASMSLLVAVAGVTACGHFGVDIGFSGDDPDAGINADGGRDDGSISGDGAADASADARDGGPLVCVGPNCPGVYVAGDVGNDTNPGTSDAPVATIAKGIELADKRDVPTDVYVAAKANSAKYGDALTFVDGVSLYGGYECKVLPCSWLRDFQTNATIIAGTDYRGIVIGDAITRNTVVDGFQIFGKGTSPNVAPGAVALTIEGAPTVRNCRIEGSSTTGGSVGNIRSIGVAILGPATKEPIGPLLDNNIILAGQANEESVAIYINTRMNAAQSATASATIRDNQTIRAAAAANSYGIFARRVAAGTVVENNTISSGASSALGEKGSWGIAVAGNMSIFRNRINPAAAPGNVNGPSCAGNVVCAGIRSDGAALVIQSNVIRGVRAPFAAAVILTAVEGTPPKVTLNGNTLDPVGDGTDNASISAAVVLENHSLANATVGHIRNNILLGGTNESRYGIFESKSGKLIHAIVVDYNAFWNPPRASTANDFAYHVWTGTTADSYTFEQLGSVTTPVPNENKGEDPKLDATFHLGDGSSCIDKGTDVDAPKFDMEAQTRPRLQGYDIGADEK